MAGRSRSTFGKRLKETKRLEKRQEKAARKDQRKQEKDTGEVSDAGREVVSDGFFRGDAALNFDDDFKTRD